MTRIIAATAIAFATLAGAASAMTTQADIQGAVSQVAPSVDVSQLNDAQRLQVLSVLLGGDSDSDKRTAIQTIAN